MHFKQRFSLTNKPQETVLLVLGLQDRLNRLTLYQYLNSSYICSRVCMNIEAFGYDVIIHSVNLKTTITTQPQLLRVRGRILKEMPQK